MRMKCLMMGGLLLGLTACDPVKQTPIVGPQHPPARMVYEQGMVRGSKVIRQGAPVAETHIPMTRGAPQRYGIGAGEGGF